MHFVEGTEGSASLLLLRSELRYWPGAFHFGHVGALLAWVVPFLVDPIGHWMLLLLLLGLGKSRVCSGHFESLILGFRAELSFVESAADEIFLGIGTVA